MHFQFPKKIRLIVCSIAFMFLGSGLCFAAQNEKKIPREIQPPSADSIPHAERLNTSSILFLTTRISGGMARM